MSNLEEASRWLARKLEARAAAAKELCEIADEAEESKACPKCHSENIETFYQCNSCQHEWQPEEKELPKLTPELIVHAAEKILAAHSDVATPTTKPATCGHASQDYDATCVLPSGHSGAHSDGGLLEWEDADKGVEIYCGLYPTICNHQCGHSKRMCDNTIECKDKRPTPTTDRGEELPVRDDMEDRWPERDDTQAHPYSSRAATHPHGERAPGALTCQVCGSTKVNIVEECEDCKAEIDRDNHRDRAAGDTPATDERPSEKREYRHLKEGEIIREGDQVDGCRDGWRDDPVWKPASCIGEPAPNPSYPSHRIYRRRVEAAPKERDGCEGCKRADWESRQMDPPTKCLKCPRWYTDQFEPATIDG